MTLIILVLIVGFIFAPELTFMLIAMGIVACLLMGVCLLLGFASVALAHSFGAPITSDNQIGFFILGALAIPAIAIISDLSGR